MSNFTEFQTYLLAILGDPYDELHWTDGLIEQAIRSALVDFPLSADPREAIFTASSSDYEQDMSSLNAKRILSISYPSEDGYAHDYHLKEFRYVDEHTVRFDTWQVQSGDELRVRYAPALTIDGLDGATSTTLYDREEHQFLLLAAAKACDLRARRMMAEGEESSRIGMFRSLSNEYYAEFNHSDIVPTVLNWGDHFDV